LTLIDSVVPGLDLVAERFQVGDSPFAEALPCEDANFNLRLIEPTAVHWCVVDGEAAPDLTADLITQQICQGFASMDDEVV
jgi:hypothetical protein